MADGFELLSAYIGLLIKKDDLNRVRTHIKSLKESLKAVSKSAGKINISSNAKQVAADVKGVADNLGKATSGAKNLNKEKGKPKRDTSGKPKFKNPFISELDVSAAAVDAGIKNAVELRRQQQKAATDAAKLATKQAKEEAARVKQQQADQQKAIKATAAAAARAAKQQAAQAKAAAKAVQQQQAAATRAANQAARQAAQQQAAATRAANQAARQQQQQARQAAQAARQVQQQQAAVARAAAQAARQQQQAVNAAARAARQQQAAQTRAANQAIRQQQQVARAATQASRQMNQAFQRTTRFIGNISLEVGFLAPQLQSLGNILRTGFQFANVGFAGGSKLGGGANPFGALFGGIGALTGFLGGTGFALATKALSVFLGVVTRIGQTLARVAWSTFASGINLLFAPTLGLVKAFRLVLQYLPLIVTSIGVGLVQSLSAASIQMERLRNLFGVAFLGKADVQLQKMITLADRMGFSFEDAAEPMAKLTFAAQQAGIELSSVDSLFRGVATAASALRLDNERLSRAFVALEQVISKGRVSSEELRQQLAESIPGIVPIVQRALGLSGQAFDDLLRKGELTAKTLIEALGPELERTFRSGAKANADSLSASVARVRNQFLLLRAELGDRIAPAFVKLQLAMLRFARSNQVFSFLQRMVDGLARMFDLIRTSPIISEFGRQFVQVFRSIQTDLVGVISKFTQLSILANGTLLVTVVRIAQVLLPKINKALGQMISYINKVTGLRITGVESAINAVLAFSSKIESLPELFSAVFDIAYIRVRIFFKRMIFEAELAYAKMRANLARALGMEDEAKFAEAGIRIAETLRDAGIFDGVPKELKQQLKAAEANIKGIFEEAAKRFDILELSSKVSGLVLDVSTSATKAIEKIEDAFGRFSSRLPGTWGKIAEGIGSVTGELTGAGKGFLRELRSGSSPFTALGSTIADLARAMSGGVDLKDNALAESLDNFRTEFFDSDSFFKALQGSDQSMLRAQRDTNNKLDEINKNIKEGNRIRTTSTNGFNSDARFRGVLA